MTVAFCTSNSGASVPIWAENQPKAYTFSLRFKCKDVKIYVVFSGGLAQLGERLHGMQEVTGSSPVSSTIFLPAENAAFVRQGRIFAFTPAIIY